MVNVSEPEEKRANFTSNQKNIVCSHNSLFLSQMGLFYVNNKNMFESKLNIYTIYKSAKRKVF